MLWYQGQENSPFIVKICIESWIKENPTWNVIVLDKETLGDYITSELSNNNLENLTLTKQSNLARLQLLSKYGGVWADSTTMCMRPLDDWIYESMSSGFFAFHKPGPDRLISTWFLSSEKNSPIITKLKEIYTSFFEKNSFNINSSIKIKLIEWLSIFLNRSHSTTKYWLSPIVIKILKIYPYFIFHYIFERIVNENGECKTIWKNTKKLSAIPSHKIQALGLFSNLNEEIKKEIDNKTTPVYKLTLYYDDIEYLQNTLLYYLLEGRHKTKA